MKSSFLGILFFLIFACGGGPPPPSAEQLEAVRFMEELQARTQEVVFDNLKQPYLDIRESRDWDHHRDARDVGFENFAKELDSIWSEAASESLRWLGYWMKNHMVLDFEDSPFRFIPAPIEAAPRQVIAEFAVGEGMEQMAFQLEPSGEGWKIISAGLYPAPKIQDQGTAEEFAMSYFENLLRITTAHPVDPIEPFRSSLPMHGYTEEFAFTGSSGMRSLILRNSLPSEKLNSQVGPEGTLCVPDPVWAWIYIPPGKVILPTIKKAMNDIRDGSEVTIVWTEYSFLNWDEGLDIRFMLKKTDLGWKMIDLAMNRARETVFEFHKRPGSNDWHYAPLEAGR